MNLTPITFFARAAGFDSSTCGADGMVSAFRAVLALRTEASNWGQIPIQDSHVSGAPGGERNWALTPFAHSPERVPSRSSPANNVIGVRVQFRSALLRAVQTIVLNWNLTPITSLARACGFLVASCRRQHSMRVSNSSACGAERRDSAFRAVLAHLAGESNWGQIPIQDKHISGARGVERNWALTPFALSPKRVPSRSSPANNVIGVRVQFRSALLRALQTIVLNWNLTPITSLAREVGFLVASCRRQHLIGART